MTIPIRERRSFLIDCEPVCDWCGHGQGLHADGADVECVACVERGEGRDCPSFAGVGAGWLAPRRSDPALMSGRWSAPVQSWR